MEAVYSSGASFHTRDCRCCCRLSTSCGWKDLRSSSASTEEEPLRVNPKLLERVRPEVLNRWLSADEIASLLPRYHMMVLPYVE